MIVAGSGRHASGFTLIELIITVTIVALLAGAAVPLAELAVKRTREHELQSALRQIREGIDAYKRAWDDKKIARVANESGYPKSLDQLVNGVPDITTPTKAQIYFLRRIPRDPTYPDAGVPAAATWGKRSYASPPDSPSEGADVFDVYSLSTEVALNGVSYREW
jgi:general secretion pathway protein G